MSVENKTYQFDDYEPKPTLIDISLPKFMISTTVPGAMLSEVYSKGRAQL